MAREAAPVSGAASLANFNLCSAKALPNVIKLRKKPGLLHPSDSQWRNF
ncbi:MAG: hypothetical protein LBS79_10055 [Tannerella sp.]|nr:hypothetical protein [Tannerella sp.]